LNLLKKLIIKLNNIMDIRQNYSLPTIIDYIKKQTIFSEIVIVPRTFNIPNECEIYKLVLEDFLKEKNVTIHGKHTFYTCNYWITRN